MFTLTVSYIITREKWFCVYFLHAENFSLSTKFNLMHIAPWSEDDLRQLSSDSYFWKKLNDWVSYKTMTTNLNRNHMAYPTLFHAVGTQRLVAVFLPLVCFLPVFFPGTVNSMRRTLFFELDHATMSSRFSVWIMWTGNCRDVLRSTETFQSLAPFSSFILGFFCFLTGHSPSMKNWIMGSLAVIDCWFAVSHCALNNSNTLLCRHMYIWSNCGHADSTWRKVPRSLLHDKHRSELVYPHNFRLVAFG